MVGITGSSPVAPTISPAKEPGAFMTIENVIGAAARICLPPDAKPG
jgi:hypothetical protein